MKLGDRLQGTVNEHGCFRHGGHENGMEPDSEEGTGGEWGNGTFRARQLLEENCGRDVKAVAELLYLLPVELSFFLQDQGHDTLAAQVAG
jgi:hypothetical protein